MLFLLAKTFLVRNPLVLLRPIMTRFVTVLFLYTTYSYEFIVNFSSLFRLQMPKRDAIIQQLKGKELKDHEILSTDEFSKERHKLVTELKEL